MMQRNALVLLFATLSLSLTACSGSSWMKGASLSTSEQNGDDYVQLSTQINTGAITLLPVTLPVLNPHNLSEQLGTISVKSGLSGGASELDLSINLSAVLSLPDNTTSGLLPNGTAIPISGVNAQNWFALPVANGLSKIYVNFDLANNKAAIGAAVSIDALTVGIAADLLIPFSFSKTTGVAGIYTGAAKGQSGFAVFADASSLLSSSAAVAFAQKKSSDTAIQQKLYQLDTSKAILKAK